MRRYEDCLLLSTLSALLGFASTAIITVDAYFPKKVVKSASKSLPRRSFSPAASVRVQENSPQKRWATFAKIAHPINRPC